MTAHFTSSYARIIARKCHLDWGKSIPGPIENTNHAEANRDEDEACRPADVLAFISLESGAPLPLEDHSVDVVMHSYIYHHLHYAEDSGEDFPASSAALLAEFSRVLKPGGTFIVIEHVANDGSTRAESAGWHRTPPDIAKADITGVGFEFADEAADLFKNPDDDLMNVWYETGLTGKTTTFVHKYRMPKNDSREEKRP